MSLINSSNVRQYTSRYYEILEKRKTLPVWHQKEEFLKVLKENQTLILVGETGSGKTTQGAFTSDIDCWKWKLTRLLHIKDKQELVSREKKDRRDFEQIAALATKMGLHSHLYAKVLVVSKVPLPNYRFDLDDKRPQREVSLPSDLQRRVDAHLKEYISYNAKTTNGSRNNLFSRITNNANDELLFEQPQRNCWNLMQYIQFKCGMQLAVIESLSENSI